MKLRLTLFVILGLIGLTGCEKKLGGEKFDASFQTAQEKYQNEEYQTAFEDFKQLAEQGYAPAELKVVEMLLDGKGVRRNEPLAVERLKKAVEKGSAEIQTRLGKFYYSGELNSLPRDYHQAKGLFEKAAEQKNASAQYHLGVMYRYGLGTRQNKQTAKEWFGKACDNGSQEGCNLYRQLGEQGY